MKGFGRPNFTRNPAGLSAVHRVVHPDLDDEAGQSMTSWKRNNPDRGEGLTSTKIYLHRRNLVELQFGSVNSGRNFAQLWLDG